MRFLATFQLYDFFDTLVSLATAFVFGTLIGAERQYRQRTAGLRTNVLVAVGAAAFVDLAMHLAGADGAVRVIAYVVSGIGFLGAGVIMKQGLDVRGLNTAATLWAIGGGRILRRCRHGRPGGGADRVRARRQYLAASAGQRDQPHPARRAVVGSDLSVQARGHARRRCRTCATVWSSGWKRPIIRWPMSMSSSMATICWRSWRRWSVPRSIRKNSKPVVADLRAPAGRSPCHLGSQHQGLRLFSAVPPPDRAIGTLLRASR